MAVVPSGKQPEPGAFAIAVSDEIRMALLRRRISGAQLAKMVGRSGAYISKRFRNEASFTANDVEEICKAIDEDLLALVIRAARSIKP